MNGNSLLKEIGRSYIVSSFIPASLFVFLSVFLFRDFIPNSIVRRFQGNIIVDGSIAFLAIFTLWVAFALYSSQDPITKFFEGYYFPKITKLILTKIQVIRHWFKTRRIERVRELLYQPTDVSTYDELQDLYPEAISDFQPLELEAPIDAELLLPTRLGNVMRASEVYPFYRYGIDGITIWPRLYNFLPNNIKDDLEKINNQLAFLLNSSLLLFILVLACIFIATTQNLCVHQAQSVALCVDNIWNRGFRHFSYQHYYFFGFMGLIISYVLYCLAVNAAITYGMYVRTAYDLYRDLLLDHLNKTLTEKLGDQRKTWERIGDFFIAGQYLKRVHFGKTKSQPGFHYRTKF